MHYLYNPFNKILVSQLWTSFFPFHYYITKNWNPNGVVCHGNPEGWFNRIIVRCPFNWGLRLQFTIVRDLLEKLYQSKSAMHSGIMKGFRNHHYLLCALDSNEPLKFFVAPFCLFFFYFNLLASWFIFCGREQFVTLTLL